MIHTIINFPVDHPGWFFFGVLPLFFVVGLMIGFWLVSLNDDF